MTTPFEKAMHAYLDPLLQKHNDGETILFEDLKAAWEACQSLSIRDSQQNERLKTLHSSQLRAYEKAAKQALNDFAQSAIMPKRNDGEDELSYFQRIYKTMEIPAWNIEQSLVDEHVGTVLRKRIVEDFNQSKDDIKNFSDSTEIEPEALDSSNAEEDIEEEKHDVSTTPGLSPRKSDPCTVASKIVSSIANKKGDVNNTDESVVVQAIVAKKSKKVGDGSNSIEATTANTTMSKTNKKSGGGKKGANAGAKVPPKKGGNTAAKVPQTRAAKNRKGASNRGRGKGKNNSNKNTAK